MVLWVLSLGCRGAWVVGVGGLVVSPQPRRTILSLPVKVEVRIAVFSGSDVESGVVPVVWWVAEVPAAAESLVLASSVVWVLAVVVVVVPAWQPLVGFAVAVYQPGGS